MKRKVVFKNPFPRMQKIACTTLCVVCTLLCWSCLNKGEADLSAPLSDEQISFNLSENGKTDPELLIGEWDVIAFAYTADGKKISDSKDVSDLGLSKLGAEVKAAFTGWFRIRIIDGDPDLMMSDAPSGLFGPLSFGNSYHFYSISGNLMFFSRFSDSSFGINLPVTDEVSDVRYALCNTYSFVIKGNELFILFTGVKNKNLLILKKR